MVFQTENLWKFKAHYCPKNYLIINVVPKLQILDQKLECSAIKKKEQDKFLSKLFLAFDEH